MAKADFDEVEKALEDAKGIAWDGCHKIYVLMDDEQVAQMREYEYDQIHTAEEMTDGEMLETIKKWFSDSCGLEFVQAVATDHTDPNAGFTTLIPQGEYDQEEIEDDTYLDDED
jgi:hypothetical protein